MSRAITARDGQRVYPDIPSGPKWSLTTMLKVYPKFLDYAAGKISMEATAAVAHDVAMEYARSAEAMRRNDEPASIESMFEDFEHSVLSAVAGRYASNKDGSPKPPHAFVWAEKAQIGEAIHAGVERHFGVQLGLVKPKMEETEAYRTLREGAKARAQVGLTLFHDWANEVKPEPLAVETVVWLDGEEMGVRNAVACRIDLACVIDGVGTILDVKSGGLDKGKPYREQFVQAEIQRRAAETRDLWMDGPFSQSGILHVPAEGGEVRMFLADFHERDALARTFDLCADLFIDLNGQPRGDK